MKAAEKTVTDLEARLAAEKAEHSGAGKELEKVSKEVEGIRAETEACKKAMAKARRGGGRR